MLEGMMRGAPRRKYVKYAKKTEHGRFCLVEEKRSLPICTSE